MIDALIPVDALRFALVAGLGLGAALAAACLHPSWGVARPRTVLAALAAVSLAAAAVLVRPVPLSVRLAIDPSTEPLLPAGDPATSLYRRAVRDFGDDQVYVIAMEVDDGDVFRSEPLAALRRVSDRVSRLDGVRAVKSLVNVTSFRFDPERDWIEVRPFIEDIPTDPAELARLRERALGDPLYRRNLVSDDGRAAALDVTFRRMSDREFIDAGLDDAIRGIVEDESAPGRRFFISGRPHVKSRMYATMVRDLSVLIPAALCVVTAVLFAFAGSVRAVVLSLATVAMAVLWTFGAVALLGRPLTILTVLLAPTLVAVGSVYGVHVVGRYEEEVERADARAAPAGRDLALRTLRGIRVPVLVAGATTAVGFGALLWTDVPAVFEIGAFSVLGVASVTVISLTGIPAALALLPPPPPGRRRLARLAGRGLDAALDRLARIVCAAPGRVLGVWALLAVLAVAALPRIVVDTDYLSFFDPDAPVRREFERIGDLFSGAVPLFVVFEGREPGRLREPAVLRRIDALQRRIDAIPGVGRTLSLLDLLRVMNRAVSGGDPAAERIPDTRGGVAELLFLVPKGDLQRYATVDQSSANVVVRTGAVGSASLRALAGRIRDVLETGVPEGLSAGVTGNAILLSRAADGVARSQPRTVGLAAAAIFVLLALSLRSLRLGLVAMVPNVVPVLLFFGALGAGAAPLSLPTSLIGSVALGVAIDATVHYLVRYRAERAAGRTPPEAVRRTNHSVGRPIAIAATMLSLGFASVAVSEFATLREFGLLTSATMAVCFLTDLLLLPALLVRARL